MVRSVQDIKLCAWAKYVTPWEKDYTWVTKALDEDVAFNRDSGFAGTPDRNTLTSPRLSTVPGSELISSSAIMAEAPDNANDDVRAVAKTVVQIPKYSGHPVATEYQPVSGTCTEVWEALNWIQRCESVRGAARWNNEVLLQQAILSLIPSSPADDWYQCELGQDDVSTWEGFKTALGRYGGASYLLKGQLNYALGRSNDHNFSDTLQFDQSSQTWNKVNLTPLISLYTALVQISPSWIILIGGQESSASTIIHADGSIIPGPNLPFQMMRHCAVGLNEEHIFIAGGFKNGISPSRETFELKWSEQIWVPQSPMTSAQSSVTCDTFLDKDNRLSILVANKQFVRGRFSSSTYLCREEEPRGGSEEIASSSKMPPKPDVGAGEQSVDQGSNPGCTT
ncbi:hypothetical protein TCAL_16736 [Tigriopus californicus]|uniref:Uncharacterized protein n=1 Tax=Tigriopus californicus TaxID=6832 RepID=A0A553PTR8_TIGCA|nr:hypothetical protein TCAL_16736 [Tigriopus californicus]